jgi:thiol-disulfide isomerase/thioredoxin
VDLQKDRGKKVFMVEFWAVWCPPCKVTVPRLSEFQKKYKDDLLIIGVTAPDFRGNTPKAVKRFVKQQGPKMIYTVAIDNNEETTSAYMLTSGVVGIPYAFLVGRDGRIVWMGSPLDPALDEIIPKVIAGSYDVEAAKIQAQVDGRFQLVLQLLNMGQVDAAWRELTEILKLDPANEAALDILIDLYVGQTRDTKAFHAWVASHMAAHKRDVTTMYRLANALCDISDFTIRVPELALEAAGAAYEESDGRDPAAIAAYARALYQIGHLDRAISLQKDAVAKADSSQRDAILGVLNYYNRCKELQPTTN